MIRFPKRQHNSHSLLARISVAIALVLSLVLLWTNWLHNLLDTDGFEPHGHSFLWNPGVLALFVGSDWFIGLACFAISAMLIYFVHKTRHDLPFQWVFVSFSVFIIACGGTHFLDVLTLWDPTYWLSGAVKLIAAVASVATAVVLPPLIPKVRAVIETAKLSEERKQQLEQTYRELEVLCENRRESEQLLSELRQSEQRKDIFLSMASHELRTPITSMKAFTQILQKMLACEERTQAVQYLAKMEVQINKLIKLMDNLLDISRIESGQLAMVEEEFEVDAFVREIIDTLQTTSTRHTILLTGHAHTTLVGDKDHLGQVFTNLLTNAIKYSPAAQTVDVSVTTNQEQVTISVRDYGIGIPKIHQDRIFECFYRVYDERDKQFPGLGIGLYIASEIIKRHGGTIWVESEEERGSTFSFSLPLKKREEEGITHPFGYCWPHPKGEAENAPPRS